MNKKVILAVAIAGAALYYQFGRNKDENQNPSSGGGTIEDGGDFFTEYNNKIVVDNKGYWMLVQNGKIYTFSDQAHMNSWQAVNPANSTPVISADDIWEFYAHSMPDVFGGSVK